MVPLILPLSIEAGVAYGLLTVAMISLWIIPTADPQIRLAPGSLFLVLSVGYAMGVDLLEPVALVPIVALGLVVYGAERETLPMSLRCFLVLVLICLSLSLMLHRLPGFIPIKVIDGVQISPDALPYTKSLNFDKPLIGLFILALGHRLICTSIEWRHMLIAIAKIGPAVLVVLLVLSVALGYVRWDVKWPSFGWVWIWTNLFFTCVSEEALFRGVLQRYLERFLERYQRGAQIALAVAALAFGLAHFAGGVKYIILATAAGWGYGYAYQRTGCIEASILTHFGLNTVHFVFFTYPALATAF